MRTGFLKTLIRLPFMNPRIFRVYVSALYSSVTLNPSPSLDGSSRPQGPESNEVHRVELGMLRMSHIRSETPARVWKLKLMVKIFESLIEEVTVLRHLRCNMFVMGSYSFTFLRWADSAYDKSQLSGLHKCKWGWMGIHIATDCNIEVEKVARIQRSLDRISNCRLDRWVKGRN